MQRQIGRLAGVVIGLVACFAQAATVFTNVDSVDAYYTSLQLNAGKPVISYYDGSSSLRLATCAANCQSATPTWAVSTVDTGVTAFFGSLQLNGGNPVVSYYEGNNADLKLATCTANCQTATPTWVVTTVDSVGNVGSFDSLQLNGGNPVIAYSDTTNLTLKLATCTANCQTATPTWVITTVDNAGNVGAYASMQLNAGKPVISYYDATNGDLKLATCAANCQTATPTWVITTVDSVGDVGYSTSLQLNGGNPVVSYFDSTNQALKLATCTANCQTATPTWAITTADAGASVGATSLQLSGGNAVVAYWEQTNRDVKLATCTANCQSATPTWAVTTIESAGDVGEFLSMQLNGGSPVISYRDGLTPALRLATSTFPTVVSIVRAGTDPTAAASVSFTVTFSESVTGVDATDFALTTSGLTGTSITAVSGSGTTWTVNANTGSGSGTLRLDLVDDDSIVGTDALGGAGAGNGSFTAGQAYTLDRAAPAIVASLRDPDANYATGAALSVSITYGKAVTVDTSGGTPFIALTIGAAIRNAAYASGSGTTTLTFRYTVQSADQDLDGIDVATSITANGGTLRDAVGNDAALSPVTVGHPAGLLVNSDVTPNAFSFAAATGQALSTVVTSNTVTIGGVDLPVAIGVSGGAYSIGCTATFTTAAGTVGNGDTVCVQHTTSSALGATVTTTLTVGSFSASFSSTTVGASPPSAPTITSATPGNAQATLAFTTPANGGSPITGYTATCGAFSAAGAGSPITVTGLTNGTTYSCTVIATNIAGNSPAAVSVSVTPRTVPGAPTITSAVTATGGTVAIISFSPPASNGGSAITGYTATCGTLSATGSNSPINLSGLPAGANNCTVTATNAAGTGPASAPASVTIFALPGAPTITSAVPGNKQVTIAFTPPASSGGVPIDFYTATCTSTSGTGGNTGPASPIVVSGLVNGASYSCSVTATNPVGVGPASASVTAKPAATATVPGAPTLSSVAPSNGQAVLVFAPPASDGGSPIISYAATCTALGAASVTATGTASPITMPGFSDGTTYNCSVTAANAIGASAASNTVGFAALVSTSVTMSISLAFPMTSSCILTSAQVKPSPTSQFPAGVVETRVDNCTAGESFKAQFKTSIASSLGINPNRLQYLTAQDVSATGRAPAEKATAQWIPMPGATISGDTVTFTLKDGAIGDSDNAANGSVLHVGGLAFAVSDTQQIPTLSEWAQLLVALLLVGSGGWAMRRR